MSFYGLKINNEWVFQVCINTFAYLINSKFQREYSYATVNIIIHKLFTFIITKISFISKETAAGIISYTHTIDARWIAYNCMWINSIITMATTI